MGEWRFNESSGDASLFLSKEKEDKKNNTTHSTRQCSYILLYAYVDTCNNMGERNQHFRPLLLLPAALCIYRTIWKTATVSVSR